MGVYFGKYELLERIGSGGMAEVFRARLPSLHGLERIVAIKRILPYHCEDTSFVQMFLDEAKITLALTHPSIGQVYELNQVEGQYYIAMEFIDGPNLSAVVKKLQKNSRRIPLDFTLHIAARVCEGLYAAHTQRDAEGRELAIIHRDISPHNIMVTHQGGVKLIDFGIAKARDRLVQTVAGTVRGKLLYMSPEQAASQDLDARSDLFSVGMTLLTLLLGQHIWKGLDEVEVLIAIRRWAPPDIRALRPDLPPDIADALQHILNRSLAVEAHHRYPHAEAFRVDLATLLARINPAFSPLNLGRFVSEVMEGREDVGEPESPSAPGFTSLPPHTPSPLHAQAQAQARATTTHLRERRRDADAFQDLTPPNTPSHSRPIALPDPDDVAPTVEIDSADLNAIRHLFPSDTGAPASADAGRTSPVVWIAAGLGVLFIIAAFVAAIFFIFGDATPTGTLSVTSDPAGASITLDGELQTVKTPATFDNLPAGEHALVLTLDEQRWERQITVQPNERATAQGDLRPPEPPPEPPASVEPPASAEAPPPSATLHIFTNQRGATLRLDDAELPTRPGADTTSRPVEVQSVELGRTHRLEVERQGFITEVLDFDLEELNACRKPPRGEAACKEITVNLKRVEPEKPRVVPLTINAIPSAIQVVANGRPLECAAPCTLKLPPGTYNLVVTNPANKRSCTRQVVLKESPQSVACPPLN